MSRTWIAGLILLGLSAGAWADVPWTLWQAERRAAQKQWAAAAQLYQQALKQEAKSPLSHFNLGVCHYQQGQFPQAEASFKKALELAPPGSLKAQAAYNQGNCLFQQKKLKEALAAYKLAQRWDDPDPDTRYNIQVVLDLLQEPPPKDPPKQEPPKQDPPKKDPPKKDPPKKDPPKKDPPKPEPPKKDPAPSQPPPKDPSQDPGKSDSQPSSPAERDKREAERLLQFFENREKQLRKRQQPAQGGRLTGEDDW